MNKYILIILCFFGYLNIIGCGYNEEEATKLLSKSIEYVINDKSINSRQKAIQIAEDLVLNYPKTNAAKEAIKKIPMWRYSIFIDEMIEYVNTLNLNSNSCNYNNIIELKYINMLIFIIEDYPNFEFREAIEAQIACLIYFNKSYPCFYKNKKIEFNTRKKINNLHFQLSGPDTDAISLQFKIKEVSLISNIKIAYNIKTALNESSKYFLSLSNQHPLLPIFIDFANILEEIECYISQNVTLMEHCLNFIQNDAEKCTKLIIKHRFNSSNKSFFSKFFKNKNVEECKNKNEELANKIKEFDKKTCKSIEKLEKTLRKANDEIEKYFSNINLEKILNFY